MRVPRGAPSGLMMTPAFSPNRMYDPSSRRVSFLVRTTTARTTSPFFTAPPGMASLTEATTTSPTPALRLLLPPSTRIHRRLRAPVLSATLILDSCCITTRPRHDVRQPPALARRERPGLDDPHRIPHARLVALVVHHEASGAPDALLVQGMPHQRLDGDRDGLVRPVGDDQPDALLAAAALGVALYPALVLIEPRTSGRTQIQARLDGLAPLDEIVCGLSRTLFRLLFFVLLFFCHYSSFSCLFWFRTVRSRAMFFRISLSCPVFSNCPVACWKRRLNSSRRVSATRCSSSSMSSSRTSVAFIY